MVMLHRSRDSSDLLNQSEGWCVCGRIASKLTVTDKGRCVN